MDWHMAGGKRGTPEEEPEASPSKKARLDPSANEADVVKEEVVKAEEGVSELKVESSEGHTLPEDNKADAKAEGVAEAASGAPDPAEFWAKLQGMAPDGQARICRCSHSKHVPFRLFAGYELDGVVPLLPALSCPGS